MLKRWLFLDIFFFVFKRCLWQPNETVWQNRNHESWTHEEASLSSSEQRVRFLFETSRIDAYSRLYFILAQGQKTTILHESFKERIDFLTATCRADSEKNEREKLILFINKWFLSLECALQNCQTFLSFGELKSKIECLTVRCFSKKNFRTFTNIFAKVTTFSTKTSYLIDVVVYIFDFVISMKKYEIMKSIDL